MKKYITLSLSLLVSTTAFAQLATGFYRVKNADTGRYVYVYDDKGKAEADGMQVKADLDAIYLRADLNNAISDPGSVIYVTKKGSDYDLRSQGTGVHAILGRYVSLTPRSGHYSVGATVSGVSAYLSDAKGSSTTGYGKISIDSNGKRLWDAIPIDSSSDNYFGVQLPLSCDGSYFSTLYTSFGYTIASESTKAYIVVAVSDKGAVYVEEVKGDVPNGTPVIVKGSSSDASNNRLDPKHFIGSVGTNNLVGVYFNTDNSSSTFAKDIHKNQTPVDGTMRFLTKSSDGKLSFAKSSLKIVPANTAYLKVSTSSPDNFVVCFTKEEYEAFEPLPEGLESISIDAANSVYNLLGKKVSNADELPAGIYIIDGKKTIIR